jgi:hypothetical protein
MPRFSRCFAVLLLVLLFLPAVLQAAEPRRDAEPLRSGSSARIAWAVLAQVWSFLTGAQSDNGCRLDPDGRCQAGQSAPVTTDNGCRLDPSGLCLPAQSAVTATDNGCRADPSGLCHN